MDRRLDEAEVLLQQASAGYERNRGKQHPSTLLANDWLDYLQRLREREAHRTNEDQTGRVAEQIEEMHLSETTSSRPETS